MYVINGIKGALFLAALVVLIFFLKIICPLDTGCLADPFLVVLLSPLWLFANLHFYSIIDASTEPFAILGFWTVVGFIVGLLVTPWISKKKSDVPSV
jgi:hypothetical protein